MKYSESKRQNIALPERIRTIEEYKESSFKEKGSVFIAQVYHVENENLAIEKISSVKKEYFDASHHCFAYKLLDGSIKYSDAGEPAGTAGIRILNAIEHFVLYNQLVIVIRYFGGTKLGVGPLGKAYYNSALNTLKESNILTRYLHQRLTIVSDFENVSHVHRILTNHNSVIENSDYGDKAIFNCLIKPSTETKIISKLTEASKGKIVCTVEEDLVYI
jgi:uncharacterized YigZ family protein